MFTAAAPWLVRVTGCGWLVVPTLLIAEVQARWQQGHLGTNSRQRNLLRAVGSVVLNRDGAFEGADLVRPEAQVDGALPVWRHAWRGSCSFERNSHWQRSCVILRRRVAAVGQGHGLGVAAGADQLRRESEAGGGELNGCDVPDQRSKLRCCSSRQR